MENKAKQNGGKVSEKSLLVIIKDAQQEVWGVLVVWTLALTAAPQRKLLCNYHIISQRQPPVKKKGHFCLARR